MKIVRFWEVPYEGYHCSEFSGDNDGEYVKAEIAQDLLAACEMQALAEQSHNSIDALDGLAALMKQHGWTSDEIQSVFIRRFRDEAIKKARQS
jgi:hypothetical protein